MSEPTVPATTAMSASGIGAPRVKLERAARKPAGIITTSLGNGMNELSTVMKRSTSAKPQTGASAAAASRYWMRTSVTGVTR